MQFRTSSRQRRDLSVLAALIGRYKSRCPARWTTLRAGDTLLTATFSSSLPSLQPLAHNVALRCFYVLGLGDSEAAFRVLAPSAPIWPQGTALGLVWAGPDQVDIRERWGTVLVEVTPDAVSVGFDLQYPRRWPAAWLLPLMISAGDLPLQLDEDDGRLVLRHRHDSQLLYTPNSEAVRLSDWRCRLPGETVAGIVARAKRILEVVATGAVRSFWDLDAPEGETANHASHLALWEDLAGAGTGTERYSVLLGLGLTALNSLDELREFPGRWTACTWLASVDLRDEDGMPLGLADDPMAPCFINFGIETSRAGHRLLLESDAPFDLAALSALTGLSFQKWR